MKVVLYFRIKEIRWTVGDDELRAAQARFPDVELVRVTEDDALPAALADADVFFGFHFPPELFATASRLRWIHSAAAGIEANLFPDMVASDVALTNAAGLHAVNIPEHAIALVCALARNVHVAQRLKAERRWDRYAAIASGDGNAAVAPDPRLRIATDLDAPVAQVDDPAQSPAVDLDGRTGLPAA
jgi:phosphoglycerate dehydrogenase-like enzyme